MSQPEDRVHRIARQHLETDRLLGVDFVPRPAGGRAAPDDAGGGGAADASGASDGLAVEQKARALEELRQRHEAMCPLCTKMPHNLTVFGEGHPDAELMFVGEAPGAEEDRTGRPFVGRAGQKLEDILGAMGLRREQVYIGNVLKSRPPDNRTPLQHEVDACAPFLAEQIRIIQPKVLVTLGGPATKYLLSTNLGITRLRGQWAEYVDVLADPPLRVPVMPTFHPAYLLRNYTRETRERMWSDMQQVMAELGL